MGTVEVAVVQKSSVGGSGEVAVVQVFQTKAPPRAHVLFFSRSNVGSKATRPRDRLVLSVATGAEVDTCYAPCTQITETVVSTRRYRTYSLICMLRDLN